MCIYFLFHWFGKERQTLKELKGNMNDGTIVFLTSLLIV